MQDVTEESAVGNGLRERKKRATRAALVEAALRLAAEHGAEHATVEAVSEAAGVSPRTFFNYFDTRDDVFVMIDVESSARIRRAVHEAPGGTPPLQVLRDALAAELAEVEDQHELWTLRAAVLRRSPHLLVRSLSAHMADELDLADALAERLQPARPAGTAPGTVRPDGRTTCSDPGTDQAGRPAPALYPRLLAAVGGTAVRVAVEHWCARQDRVPFADVFREVFDHLAAGLPAPPGADAG